MAEAFRRWAPVYDEDGLKTQIRELSQASDYSARFWSLLSPKPGDVAQGDVVQLASDVPMIDENGEAVATDACELWMVIGNTCDFDRVDVPWTQLVPLVSIENPSTDTIKELRAYIHGRRFYVPPWPPNGTKHHVADFTRPVTADKAVFGSKAVVVATMQHPAWVLLNACLVRYLARNDGRHD